MKIIPTHRCLFLTLSFFALILPSGLHAESPQEQKERTITALEQAVRTDPNNGELWVHMGFAYQKAGQIDQAQKAFEKASAIDPRNRDALYMLGLIYEKKNMNQDAARVWKAYIAAETDPGKRANGENHLHHVAP